MVVCRSRGGRESVKSASCATPTRFALRRMTRIATLDETPEQVLALAEWHAASLRRAALARGPSHVPAPVPVPAPGSTNRMCAPARGDLPGTAADRHRSNGLRRRARRVAVIFVSSCSTAPLPRRSSPVSFSAARWLRRDASRSRGGGHWASRSAASSHSCRDRRDVAVDAPRSAARRRSITAVFGSRRR